MQTMFNTRMSANSTNHPDMGNYVEETHSSDEIISHANETLAQQMGLELCSFVGLESKLIPGEDGDEVIYVDQSGRRVEFTEDLQLKAAIAVLNTNGHFFEATPLH